MDVAELEQTYNVKLIPKNKSIFMRIAGFFFGRKFREEFWTTYRVPFKKSIITYPAKYKFEKHDTITKQVWPILEHELIHAKYLSTSWGLFKAFWLSWLVPLPIVFSGRWFLERYAYLHNIIYYNNSMEEIISMLWKDYWLAWPKPLMRRWFNKKVSEYKRRAI